MATGTGLDAQLVIGEETTWGTAVTPARALEFNTESLKHDLTWLEPTGLRNGVKYKRSGRVRVARHSITGDFDLEWTNRGMGMLVKHMMGAAAVVPTQIAATTAYRQVHTPGDYRTTGGLTVQVGRPEPATGTVRPFTFAGCQIPKWEFSLKDNAIPTLKITLDGRSEATATALVAAAYLANTTVYDFSQATLTLGGTVATTSGVAAVTGGVAVATIVKDITITGAAPMDTSRFGIGNAGLKSQQLENATPTINGKLTAEFGKAEIYDVFTANTATPLQLTLTGSQIGTSGNNFLVQFLIPSVRFKAAPPQVTGPGVVMMSTDFEGYSDESNAPIQILIQSDETTL